jgi:chromosome segregation ATPase
MSLLTALYYIIGLIVAFATVSAFIMFTVELFHHMQLITDRCDTLEKELKKCKAALKTFEADVAITKADIVATNANIVVVNADAAITKADMVSVKADIAGMSEHMMMSLQESIEDLYAKEKKAKEDRKESRNNLKLLDRCMLEMRSRITVVETRSEHTVEKTDDILECLSLLQERIAANEESAKLVAELKDFVSHLHELSMAGDEKMGHLKTETNKLRTVVSILQQRASAPTEGRRIPLMEEDYQQKYNFGF